MSSAGWRADATDKELRVADYLTKHEINYWRINNHDCYVDFQNLNQRIGNLSGGEKVKLQIMRILSQELDVLLLDEPTNDIDIKTLDWLEEFIQKVPQAVLFVSHDEILIENVSNQIIHLEQTNRKTIYRHTITKLPYSE